MKLRNAELAAVPEPKITRYLLNPRIRPGAARRCSFSSLVSPSPNGSAWALRSQAIENEVIETEETQYGTRYAIDGPLPAPDGTVLNVRSAWFIDPGSEVPRFITAHPLPKQ